VNVRSVEWRYGEEQIAMALELLSIESDLLNNIHAYFSEFTDTFRIAKS